MECFAEAVELVKARDQVLARNLRIRGVHEVMNIFYVFWRPVLESGVLQKLGGPAAWLGTVRNWVIDPEPCC